MHLTFKDIFVKSVYEQHHMRSSMNFAMHKMKAGQLTSGTIKQNCRGIIVRFIAIQNAFFLMSSVKGTPAYWEKFLYHVHAKVKQLGIPAYLLTLSCTDLR